jgi:imidazolonepropionase-like amidohydrolase/pimeloyl-ACP methyl ester carboxylesterase
MKKQMANRQVTGAALAMTGWLLGAVVPALASTQPPALAIEHVTVLPFAEDAAPLRDRTVVLDAGRIATIEPSQSARVAAGVERIDGRGKWLMPSLTDMHVHIENERVLRLFTGLNVRPGDVDPNDLFLPFVANGVLQIFDPAATAESIARRDDVEAGRILGPHIELAAMVDGDPPIWPFGFAHVAATPADGRQFVRDMKADGFRFVKTYSNLALDTFEAVLDESRKQGIRVVGHIPGSRQDQTEKYLRPGFEMVVHAEQFAYQPADVATAIQNVPRYVSLAKANGTWLTSTVSLNERIVEQMRQPQTLTTRPEMRFVNPLTREFWTAHSSYANAPPERIARLAQVVGFNEKLVKAFVDAGIPVLPGTDTTVPGMVAGSALHDELEALARAGLTSEQILTAATRLAAQWLRVQADRGTVEPGKRADLLLLDADPLADVRNTRRIAAVIANGRYLARAELDKRMEDLARRYAAEPALSGTAARVIDDPVYTRAQQLVSIGGGRKMNLYCLGEGPITVVFDSGLSDPNTFWAFVQPQVAQAARACSYDRAGMGFSDASHRPGTSENIVDDLHALLRAASIAPPYLLVGHSFGGMNVRLFADKFPDEVAGMVLVDPGHEDQVARYEAAEGAADERMPARLARHRECAAAATRALQPGSELFSRCVDPASAFFGPRINAALRNIQSTARYQQAQLSEVENIVSGVSTGQARAARRSYGDMPLIVLSRTQNPASLPARQATPRLKTLWSLHDELASLSSAGVHRGVENSGHYIQLDQPAAVTTAIQEILRSVAMEAGHSHSQSE